MRRKELKRRAVSRRRHQAGDVQASIVRWPHTPANAPLETMVRFTGSAAVESRKMSNPAY
jgi:hypothetical protein